MLLEGRLPFIKMHGLGNDFVILENCVLNPEMISFMADRKTGIGCDQVVIMNSTGHPTTFQVYLFNPDASSAGACGNAMRCLTKLLYTRFPQHRYFTFQVMDYENRQILRTIAATVVDENSFAIDMGRYSWQWRDIPLSQDYEILPFTVGRLEGATGYPVSVGNPHFVIMQREHFSLSMMEDIGLALQHHPLFPHRVNVNFAQLRDDATLILQVWERGTGLTMACGSGACAAAVVGYHFLGMQKKIKVIMPGGELEITVEPESVIMQGGATFVFQGVMGDGWCMAMSMGICRI
jgi:diaminopimelate epimerase